MNNSFLNRGIARQSLSLALMTGLGQISIAVMFVLAARVMPPDDFGRVTTAVFLGLSASALVDFGANAHWVREGASKRMSVEETASRTQTKLLLGLAVLPLVACALALIISFEFGITFGLVALANTLSQSTYVGLRRIRLGGSVALCLLMDRIASLLSFLVLLTVLSPGVSLALGMAAGALLGTMLGVLLTPRGFRTLGRRVKLSNPWAGGLGFGFSSLASAIQSLETQAVALVGGATISGYFNAVSRWTQPLGLLTNSFALAAAPFLASASKFEHMWRSLGKSILLPIGAVVGAVMVVASAHWIVPVLLGSAYTDSVLVLQILALGSIPGTVNQMMVMFLQAAREEHAVATAMLFVSILQLLIVALATFYFGLLGAATASALGQIFLMLWLFCVFVLSNNGKFREKTRRGDAF